MIINKALVEAVGKIAQEAGNLIIQTWHGGEFGVEQKPGAGIVTVADKTAERHIIKKLQALDTNVAFVAEESGAHGNADWEWVIDPLDGTTNFAYKIPYFCVSIALTYHGQPQLGVIYNPLSKELFWAIKDHGSWCADQRLHVATRLFEHSLIALSVPYDDQNVDWSGQARRVSDHVHDIRRMGSAALDLAYVAAGHFDGAFFERLSWWDIAAGVLLIQEAGGVVTDFNKLPITKSFTSFIAATPVIYEQILAFLKK